MNGGGAVFQNMPCRVVSPLQILTCAWMCFLSHIRMDYISPRTTITTRQEFTLTFGLLTLIYLAITIIGLPGQVGARPVRTQYGPPDCLIDILTHPTSRSKHARIPQRPVIAAGIRGLIVAGGKYTGPAMNPMIAFGWAVHTGAYKVGDSREERKRLRRADDDDGGLIGSRPLGVRLGGFVRLTHPPTPHEQHPPPL